MSAEAPRAWTGKDNLRKAMAEVCRLAPDVLALQECPTERPVAELGEGYRPVGTAKSHCGFVHLYLEGKLAYESLTLKAGLPVVGCVLSVGGVRLTVLALSLIHI